MYYTRENSKCIHYCNAEVLIYMPSFALKSRGVTFILADGLVIFLI